MSFGACIPVSALLLALIYVPVGYHVVSSWRLFRDGVGTGKEWRRIFFQAALIALWWTVVPLASMTILVLSLYNAERSVQGYATVVIAIAFFPDQLLGALPLTYPGPPVHFALYWVAAMVILLLISALVLVVQRVKISRQKPAVQ